MRNKKFQGQVFALYFIIYPIVRSFVELFRGDLARKFVPLPGAPQLISTGQATSLLLFIAGVSMYVYLKKRHEASLQ